MTRTWSYKHTLAYFLICFLFILLRLYEVDLRPLHHDESLHGAYSLYFFQDPLTGFYKYDPLLHGPFLYHTIPWFYWIFGLTKYALRFPAVLFSSALLFIPILFREKLNKSLIFLTLVLLGTSPTLTYWSRFLRHDNFIHFSFFLLILAFYWKNAFLRTTLIGLSLAIHLSAKENFYIHATFLLAYGTYEYFSLKILKKENSAFSALYQWIKSHKLCTLWGSSVFLFVTFYYYSAGFYYPQGISSLLKGEAFSYWANQHQTERITGPFSFPFLINSFFESWWFPLLFLQPILFFKKRIKELPPFLFALALACLFYANGVFNWSPRINQFTSLYFKLKIPFDHFLFLPLISYSLIGVTSYLKEDRRQLAFAHFIFTATFFTYSFVGEKVPWLAAYPLLAGIYYYTLYFRDHDFKALTGSYLLVILLNIPILLWANWYNDDQPGNLLTQVHTSSQFEQKLFFIQGKMRAEGASLLAKHETTWPTTWYVHGFPSYHYGNKVKATKDHNFLLTTTNDPSNNDYSLLGLKKEKLLFRSWWLPDYEKLSPLKFFNYMIFKKIYGGVGHHYVALWSEPTLPIDSNRK